MIPKKLNDSDYEEIGGDGGVEASIDLEDISHIFELLSNIYKDNYGSIVRELSSNCFDAHRAADIDDNTPIVIKFQFDNLYNTQLVFRDFGNGMSPEFMETVYMKYGKSTKRNTDKQYGMFGIGSKSPFSISDFYNINSYIDGVKYEYLIYKHRNEKGFLIPKYDIISESETKEPNGTEIVISLDYTTKSKFIDAIKKQLLYFQNIIYENIPGISNEFTILEKEYFKVSTFNDVYNTHICFGNVYYPIDFKMLNIEPLNLNLGLKFDINELSPIPSREDILYSDDSIILIKEKIKLALIEYLDNLNINLGEPIEVDIYEYFEVKEKIPYNYKEFIKYVKYLDKNFGYIYCEIPDSFYTCSLLKKYNALNIKQEAFKNLINYLVDYKAVINKSVLNQKRINLNSPSFYIGQRNNIYRLSNKSRITRAKTLFLNDAILIERKDYSINQLKSILFSVINHSTFSSYIADNRKGGKFKNLIKLGLEYIKNNTHSYDDIIITQEQEEELVESKKRLSSGEIKLELVNCKNSRKDNTENVIFDNFINQNKHRLTKYIVTNYDNVKLAYYLDSYLFKIENKKGNQTFKIILTSNKNEKMLSEENNLIILEDFIKNNRIFKKLALSLYYEEEYEKLNISYSHTDYIDKNILDKINILKFNMNSTYIRNNILSYYEIEKLKKEIIQLAHTLKLITKEDRKLIEDVKNYFSKIPLLKYLDNKVPNDLIINYFKQNKVMMNKSKYNINQHYTPSELQLIEESKLKISYLKSINKLNNEYENQTTRELVTEICRSKSYSGFEQQSKRVA